MAKKVARNFFSQGRRAKGMKGEWETSSQMSGDLAKLSPQIENWCKKTQLQLGTAGMCKLSQLELVKLQKECHTKIKYTEFEAILYISNKVRQSCVAEENRAVEQKRADEDWKNVVIRVREKNEAITNIANNLVLMNWWDIHTFCLDLKKNLKQFGMHAQGIDLKLCESIIKKLLGTLQRIDHELQRFTTVDLMESDKKLVAEKRKRKAEKGFPKPKTSLVPLPGPRLRNMRKNFQARQMFAAGASAKQVHFRLGIPLRTAYNWKRKY